MTVAVEKLKQEIVGLTMPERAELVRFLIDSLDEGEDEGAEAAWDAELARRAAEIKQGDATGRPADEVFAEIRKRFA